MRRLLLVILFSMILPAIGLTQPIGGGPFGGGGGGGSASLTSPITVNPLVFTGATTFQNNSTTFGNATGPVVFTFNVTGTDPTLTVAAGSFMFPASTYLNFGTTAGTTGYGIFDSAGTLNFKHSGGAWWSLAAPGTAGNIAKSDGTNWTSSNSLSLASLDMTSATSAIPWVIGTAAAPTTEGWAYWNSSTDTLTIGNGASATEIAKVGGALGAATATSLITSGVLQGPAGEIICAALTTLTAAQTNRTYLNSYGRGGAVTNTLPVAAKGASFTPIVGTQHNSAWKIQVQGTDTIIFNGVAGKTYIQETNQIVGSKVSCGSFQTAAAAWTWVCDTSAGVWASD